VAPDAVTVTVPLYAPAARPDGFTEILTDAGTVPLGVAESHVPPVVVAAAVVKLIPDVPETLTDWAAGVLPPVV
jgi:hypothetical protein